MELLIFLCKAIGLGLGLFLITFAVLFIRNFRKISALENEALGSLQKSNLVKVETVPGGPHLMYDAFSSQFLLQDTDKEQLMLTANNMFSNLIVVESI